MDHEYLRNVAIIAHVDHGKTTLVDQLLRQSGQFRAGELQGDCILDSNPLERERGITILSKNCAIDYLDPSGRKFHINIIDTPGHADFSGEVERVLKMADGVLLLVDAFEGVMPQTRYVLAKAMAENLRPVVVVNKMDRPDARPSDVVVEVFDLLVDLGAGDSALDFPVIYASGREGWSSTDPDSAEGDMRAVFEAIVNYVPAPEVDEESSLRALITSIDYSDYLGRIGIGRVFSGSLESGRELSVISHSGETTRARVTALMKFERLGRAPAQLIEAGDLFAIAGIESIGIGDTLCSLDAPAQIPSPPIDEPTVQMTFRINDGPLSGLEGKFVTGRQIRERLLKELRTNVALRVEDKGDEFHVRGRGILHLGILLENMRREGYELTVGKPQVIMKKVNGQVLEPFERLSVDVKSENVGTVMQLAGERRADMKKMEPRGSRMHLEFEIPARGLVGMRSRLLNSTQGEAVMHHRFLEYAPHKGSIPGRNAGVLIATESGRVTSYALEQLTDRGVMFVEPGEPVYEGEIVGEHCKEPDIPVNAVKQKQMTNIRSSTKEATVTLKAARKLELEVALEYIEDDELVEITPKSIRLRKKLLKAVDRRRNARSRRIIE